MEFLQKLIKVDQNFLERYLKSDEVGARLERVRQDEMHLTCNNWLSKTPPKRAIFRYMYDFCFRPTQVMKILDVGGGFSSFTPQMLDEHDYTLCDLMAHDTLDDVQKTLNLHDLDFVRTCDWFDLGDTDYDLVIANDLFPNVDQRLEMFLDKFLPRSKKVSLSLTVYEDQRFYLAQRSGLDEYLTFLAWNSDLLLRVLEKYKDRVIDPNFGIFDENEGSLYSNNRQVCLVNLQGFL